MSERVRQLVLRANVAGGMLAVGYVTTALHGLLVVLELAAAASVPRRAPQTS